MSEEYEVRKNERSISIEVEAAMSFQSEPLCVGSARLVPDNASQRLFDPAVDRNT